MIKLGIIGMSEGNGHPYSWSAIFNGYDSTYMKDCGYPVINQYLSQRSFPEDCIPGAEVTHVWTQDIDVSKHIAKSSNIKTVCKQLKDMITDVDAVLLARDDAENHYQFAKPFLEAGIPIYIDKPLAVKVSDAQKLFDAQKYEWQIFSCSALKYSLELDKERIDWDKLGELKVIQASIPKEWNTYAVHIIEPVLNFSESKDRISSYKATTNNKHTILNVHWHSGLTTSFNVLGDAATPIELKFIGTKGVESLTFTDSFGAFKKTLEKFIEGIKSKKLMISRDETLKVIDLIEKGNNY